MVEGVEGSRRIKRRFQYRADELVQEAQKAEQEAEAAGKEADGLEQQLENL